MVYKARSECSLTTLTAFKGISARSAARRPVKYATTALTEPRQYKGTGKLARISESLFRKLAASNKTAAYRSAIGKWTISG
jgi:hypothetical protein